LLGGKPGKFEEHRQALQEILDTDKRLPGVRVRAMRKQNHSSFC
jgi:hypothetical protein